jgi:purine nucleosidase
MRYCFYFFLIAAAAAMPATGSCSEQEDYPVSRLIFDTDLGNDVDDVMALGVIHALQSRGECELLAVTVTKDNELAAPFVDAINTFYGRGEIPIGVVRGGATPDERRFLPLIRQQDQGRFRYPHDLLSGKDAPEATALLRQVLSNQPDRSVVIVQVGFSTNLARLLDSRADDHSPLSGRELVQRKVKLLSMVGGAFGPVKGNPRYLEFNIVEDLPSTQSMIQAWPTSIVISGYELGDAIRYPAESIVRDYRYVPHHPLADAYWHYVPPPHNRPTWDLTSVLYAVYPERRFFTLSPPGRVTIESDGFTRFDHEADGPHRHLVVDDQQIIRVREALVQLASQPPTD